MKNPSKKIAELADKHSHITVFTQNIGLVRDFLLKEGGRWQININEVFWPIFKDKKIYDGKVIDGYKIGMVSKEEADIGFDSIGSKNKILFTKNPFIKIPENSFIIKDQFSFPKIKRTSHYPPILALQKEGTNMIIVPDGAHDYIALHDQFVMQGIEHSLETSGEIKPTHIIRKPIYFENQEKIILYGIWSVEELFKLDKFEKIFLVRNSEFFQAIQFEKIEEIMRCFSEMPEYALSAEYIGYKTIMHPDNIRKILQFMSISGCVKRVRVDDQQITIYKKGTPPDSLEFHSIPEGQFKISDLIKHLQIPREDLFPLLKKYEKNGLIFSYVPSNNLKLWAYQREMTKQIFYDTMRFLNEEENFLGDLIGNEEEKINSYLESKIQTYCMNNKSEALFHHSGEIISINPTSKALTF